MAVVLSSFAKDTFIAPFLSALTSAEIPDLSTHCSPHWVSAFVLNSMLRAKMRNPYRQYTFNFLRRAEGAFRVHDLARSATLTFLQGTRQSASQYMAAMFYWEIFLAQSWQAYDLWAQLFKKLSGEKVLVFQNKDGSVEQRLHALYNQSKHAESVISDAKLPEDATIPVWLTNAGLSSLDTQLSYAETGEVLKDLAQWAQILVDPLTMREKLNALEFRGHHT